MKDDVNEWRTRIAAQYEVVDPLSYYDRNKEGENE